MNKQEIINELKQIPCCDGEIIFEGNEIRCDDCDLVLAECDNQGNWYLL